VFELCSTFEFGCGLLCLTDHPGNAAAVDVIADGSYVALVGPMRSRLDRAGGGDAEVLSDVAAEGGVVIDRPRERWLPQTRCCSEPAFPT